MASSESDQMSDALGADVVLPVTGKTVYDLRQQIVRLEAEIEWLRAKVREAMTECGTSTTTHHLLRQVVPDWREVARKPTPDWRP